MVAPQCRLIIVGFSESFLFPAPSWQRDNSQGVDGVTFTALLLLCCTSQHNWLPYIKSCEGKRRKPCTMYLQQAVGGVNRCQQSAFSHYFTSIKYVSFNSPERTSLNSKLISAFASVIEKVYIH